MISPVLYFGLSNGIVTSIYLSTDLVEVKTEGYEGSAKFKIS
jgi:hypothetical protein